MSSRPRISTRRRGSRRAFRAPRSGRSRSGRSSRCSRKTCSGSAVPDHIALEAVFRGEADRVLATLIRLGGDFELAEEGLQDAFSAALERWPRSGLPSNPRAWLVNTGRHKAIDRLRRRIALRGKLKLIGAEAQIEQMAPPVEETVDEEIADDRLRLIFTCCHPALAMETRVALTLRMVGGLTVAEIARAFLVQETAMG